MQRSDFQRLAKMRSAEAAILFRSRQHSGSYYLAGLAVECALKAAIAKATRRFEFPDRQRAEKAFRHGLADLLNEAGLRNAMEGAPASVQTAWAIVKDWRIDSRYQTQSKAPIVRDFLSAALGAGGVMEWLMAYW